MLCISDVCVYNGQVYRQGDKWQDGCKYVCECVDANSGRYKCVERSVFHLYCDVNTFVSVWMLTLADTSVSRGQYFIYIVMSIRL